MRPTLYLILFFSFASFTNGNNIKQENGIKPQEEKNIYAKMISNGVEREYIVHLPKNNKKDENLPLVINLHGLTVTNEIQMNYTGFNKVADENKFIVVYPQGLKAMVNGKIVTHWNARFGTRVKDVQFIDELIDRLFTDYSIDLKRVYVTGFSNGGFMSYRLACELSDRITAIAPVSGNMAISQQQACKPAHKIPVIHIHGTKDKDIPVSGVPNFMLSSQASLGFFIKNNGCNNKPKVIDVKDINTKDSSSVKYFIYGTCDDKSEVRFYEVTGGGHTWPDALEAPHLGHTNRDFNASKEIWQFFSRFSHPNPRKGRKLD